MLAEGFLAYQWEKNGVIISTAKSPTYTATTPGVYRARFSRKSSAPTASQWNRWSAPVNVTEVTSTTLTTAQTTAPASIEMVPEADSVEEVFSFSVYPNPATRDNVNLHLQGAGNEPVRVKMIDQLGKEVYATTVEPNELAGDQRLILPATVQGGVYILLIRQGQKEIRQKVVLRN